MPNEHVIKQKLRTFLSQRVPMSTQEFIDKVNDLFADSPEAQITTEHLERLISSGFIQTMEEDQITPQELLKLNPISLVDAETFATETGLTIDEVHRLLEEGKVAILELGCIMITRQELRRYWREHDQQVIYTMDDLLTMLDNFFRDDVTWWNNFFSDRVKGVPFFLDVPDENLVNYLEEAKIQPKRVLELGCGNGRNAVYLANKGCDVTAIDLSQEAINWGREMAEKKGAQIQFICDSIFDVQISGGGYDFIYDGGCFHHILPHRRFTYLELIKKALKPGGFLGMTCFKHDNAGANGPDFSDWEIYHHRWSGSGMAFSRHQLEQIFGNLLEIVEFRQMKEVEQPSDVFGVSCLWSVLFRRK